MNRFNEIKVMADQMYATIENAENRAICLEHSSETAKCAVEIAKLENYDSELVEIAAYLHDCAQYLEKGHQHAYRSSILARDLLVESQLFATEEITRIMNTIAHHSDKNRIDLPCDEILKNADILAKYRSGEVMDESKLARIKKYL